MLPLEEFREAFDTPLAVAIDREVWEAKDDWVRTIPNLSGRCAEHALRVAGICAAFDGKATLRVCDLGPARAFAENQARVRHILRPNPGENPDAKCSFAIITALERASELGRVFWPSGEALPNEARILGVAADLGATASAERVRATLLEVEGLLELVSSRLAGLTLESVQDELPGLHPGRGARLRIEGKDVGSVGQLSPDLAARFEAGVVVLGEINFEPVAVARHATRVVAPSRHPAVRRDLAITVPELTPARNAIDAILAAGEVILRSVELFDEYHGPQVEPGRKGLTFRLAFQADDRTLRGEEVGIAESRILKSLESRIDATPRL